MTFPSKAVVDRIKAEYPAGTKVELLCMNDPYREMPAGLIGTVTCVDDSGTVFCRWSNDSTLGLVYGEDSYRKI